MVMKHNDLHLEYIPTSFKFFLQIPNLCYSYTNHTCKLLFTEDENS